VGIPIGTGDDRIYIPETGATIERKKREAAERARQHSATRYAKPAIQPRQHSATRYAKPTINRSPADYPRSTRETQRTTSTEHDRALAERLAVQQRQQAADRRLKVARQDAIQSFGRDEPRLSEERERRKVAGMGDHERELYLRRQKKEEQLASGWFRESSDKRGYEPAHPAQAAYEQLRFQRYQEYALDQLQAASIFLNSPVDLSMKRMWGGGSEQMPTVNTVSQLFDPNNPRAVSFVQAWANRQNAGVKLSVDGQFGPKTVEGLAG